MEVKNLHDETRFNFIEIAPAEQIPPGRRLFVEVDDTPIVVFNINGDLYAIGDTCTHDDGPLGDGELEGFEVVCQRHGARFDVRTGKVTALPAVVDNPVYPVRLRNGKIEIGLPKGN